MSLASAGAPFSYSTHTPGSTYSFSSGVQALAAAPAVYSGYSQAPLAYASAANFGYSVPALSYAAAPAVSYATAPAYYQTPAVVKSMSNPNVLSTELNLPSTNLSKTCFLVIKKGIQSIRRISLILPMNPLHS